MNIEELTLDEIAVRKADIIERRDKMMTELETVEEKDRESFEQQIDDLNAEERSLMERESALMQIAEERAKQIAEVEAYASVKHDFVEERKMDNLEIRKSQSYLDAYVNYIKTGDDSECRALLTENVSGTVPVAEYVEGRVRTAWEREGITARVRKTYLKGNVKIGFELSADGAVVHTEAANSAVSPENLVLAVTNLIPESIKKFVEISDEVMDMTSTEFVDYIYDELTYRIAKKVADLIVADIDACGTVSTTNKPAVAKITSTQINVGLVAQALANISDEATDPVVIMNKQTWGAFKAAQAANGYNYDPFEGLPVIFNNSLSSFAAATTGVTYMIVGDLGAGAQLNFPSGDEIEIKFDDRTKMEYDLVRILGREYVGHGVVAPNAFCKVCH